MIVAAVDLLISLNLDIRIHHPLLSTTFALHTPLVKNRVFGKDKMTTIVLKFVSQDEAKMKEKLVGNTLRIFYHTIPRLLFANPYC